MDYRVISGNRNNKQFYMIEDKSGSVMRIPSQYLKHIAGYKSQNSVRKAAYSLTYYLRFLDEYDLSIESVCKYGYMEMTRYYKNYLNWLKGKSHVRGTKNSKPIKGKTCNAHLREVFKYFEYLVRAGLINEFKDEISKEEFHKYASRNKGGLSNIYFKHYFKEEPNIQKKLSKEEIIKLSQNCTNIRDALIIRLLLVSGFRIGELLGIHLETDINFESKEITVMHRDDNENHTFAKNYGRRKIIIDEVTFELMVNYISRYSDLLVNSRFLFIKLKGKDAGKPLDSNCVYSLFKRLYKKTEIKAKPHAFRHAFAELQRKSGTELERIQALLGHEILKSTMSYLGTNSLKENEAIMKYHEEILSNFKEVLS